MWLTGVSPPNNAITPLGWNSLLDTLSSKRKTVDRRPLESDDPLENEDLENEDPLENVDLENENPLRA